MNNMMSDTYVECLVKKKNNTAFMLLRILSVMLSVVFIFIGMVFMIIIALIIGVLIGVAAYFIYLNSDLEYEYLYLDKEITVDKVMAKTKRKRVAKYDIERLEIFAPIRSHHLDAYKNRTVKAHDFSSGVEKQPDTRYVMYYDGNEKLILEPSMEMVKAIKYVAPRKVFTD